MLWFDATRGYGFINPVEGDIFNQRDLFVQFHNIIQRGYKSLRKDDLVEFCVGQNERGMCASEVKLLHAAEETPTPTPPDPENIKEAIK